MEYIQILDDIIWEQRDKCLDRLDKEELSQMEKSLRIETVEIIMSIFKSFIANTMRKQKQKNLDRVKKIITVINKCNLDQTNIEQIVLDKIAECHYLLIVEKTSHKFAIIFSPLRTYNFLKKHGLNIEIENSQ